MIQSPNSTVADILSRRDARWVMRRCARRGHVVAHLSDPAVSALTGPITGPPDTPDLLCCLRCGNWVDPQGALVSELLGTSPSRRAGRMAGGSGCSGCWPWSGRHGDH
jgi:hypothetical protein